MGNTRNTGYLQNIVLYDANDNITLPARLAVTGTVSVNNTTPYDTTQFSLDVNGGLIVKNINKTAQFVLINSNPASGGNNAFVVHTVGGTSASSYADIQGYYGTSIAGSTVLRLNPQGGNVLVGSLAGTGSRMVVADATGVLSTQAIVTLGDLSGVSTARTITINGTTQDLSANRTWTLYTDDISEDGSPVNLWFTNARARAAISVTGSGSYDSATGVITVTGGVTAVNTKTGDVTLTSSDITEGTRLYYTDARARAAISVTGSGSYNSTTGVITVTGGVTSVNTLTGAVTLTTTNIAEGTNLYYTDARVLAYLGANSYATQSYVGTQIANLVASAPSTLDTLNELAAALGNDASFATTTATSLGNRLRVDTAAQGLNSTQQSNGRTNLGLGSLATLSSIGNSYITDLAWSKLSSTPTTISGYGITNAYTDAQIQNFFNGANAISGYNKSNWDTAYGWGNHASAGYLTTSSASSTYLTSATAATTYVSLTGSYANPSWITSLAYSKITGVPAFITSYTETDTLATVVARGSSTSSAISAANFQVAAQVLNLDTVKTPGLYHYDGAYTGTQPIQNWYNVRTIEVGNSTRASQFVMPYSADRIFYRRNTDSGWQPYIELYHTGNLPTIPTNNNQLTNGAGYITSYTETDTLASVTGRGASTSTALTLSGKVTFSSSVSNRPQLPGGFLGLDTSDGDFDIWGISRDYYPSHPTAANAWGLRWNGTNNDFEFVGAGTSRVILDMDGGNITATGTLSASNYSGTHSGSSSGTNTGDQTNISGNAATATNLSNSGTVTLATATESNSIYITQPSYTSYTPVKLLNFAWYSDIWSLGNIRSTGAGSSGFGIFLNSVEKFRFTDGAMTIAGNTVYHGGNIPTWNQSTTGNAATSTTFSTGRTNYKGNTDNAVAGQLMWKQYGNNHTIFDASNGTSPDGTTVSRHTPQNPVATSDGSNTWGVNPNLMGWNGSNTFGVKVDWSRYSESTGSVAWSNVSSRPTNLSSFTNDLGNYGGWITGVTNISGYSGSVNIPDWRNTSYTPAQYDGNRVNWHFNNTSYNNSPPGDFWGAMQTVSPWSEYNDSHRQSQLWWGGSGGLSYRYAVGSGYTVTGWSSWERIITSATISSQSVVTIQDSPPSGSAGRLWWESDTGKLKVYYGSAWVDASPIPDSSLFFAKAGGSITGDVSIGQTLNVVGNTLVQGNINAFGDITAYSSSDARLKDNITIIESPLEKLSKINGVSFNWNDKQSVYEVGAKDYGVIAQEVEEVLPELVTTRDNGYKAVRYEKIVSLLIEAIKEQQTQINNLTDKLNKL